MTDPVADMLTRIRNACMNRMEKVEMPASKMKLAIAKILKDEGFIKKYRLIKDKRQGTIIINLRYDDKHRPIILGLKKISRPGLRVYVGKDEIPEVLGGYGVAVLSTSKGILTDRDAKSIGVGGEHILNVW